MSAAVASKGLGLIREIFVASVFGAGGQVDAFVLAVSLTTAVSGIGSSLSAALVPTLRRVVIADGSSDAADLAGGVVTIALAVSLLVALVLFVAPVEVLDLVAPSVPEPTLRLAARLVRWLAGLVVAVNLFFVLTGVYHAMEHFKAPAVLDLSSNVLVLASLVVLSPALGIQALPIGLILGTGTVAIAIGMPLLARRLVSFGWGSLDRRLREVVALSAPVLLWDVLWQTVPIVENFFGAGLAVGSLSALGYARRLSFLVVSLVAVNVSRAVFPVFSRLVAEGRRGEAHDLLAGLYRQCVLIFVPVSVLLMLLSPDAVGLVFERGAFDAHAADLTARVLVFYAAGLVPAVALPLCVRACYAFSDMVTPLLGVVVGLAALAGLSTVLAPGFGAAGVALASSLALVPSVAVMLIALARRLGGLEMPRLARVTGLSVACAVVAILPAKLVDVLQFGVAPGIARVTIIVPVYAVAYVSLAWTVMRSDLLDLGRLAGVARGGG